MLETPLHRFLYVSDAALPVTPEAIEDILTVSRRNNAACGVTGALLLVENAFLQVLEGPREAVQQTAARVSRDSRHRGIIVLADDAIASRSFGGWAMGCDTVGPDGLPPEARLVTDSATVSAWMQHAGDALMTHFIENFFRIHRPGTRVA